MWMRIAPPGRASSSQRGLVKWCGPHHWAMCSGSVQTLNTRARGASKTRVSTSSSPDPLPGCLPARAAAPGSLFSATLFLLGLKLFQVIIEPVEALFPELPVELDPRGGVLQRPRLQPARPPLRFAAAGDEPRALEHLQVLGNRRQGHVERLGQLVHRRLPPRQPPENRPPSRVGKGRERGAEGVRHRCTDYLTDRLIN